uniref:UDP-D-xylose:beta-D-glucoside alpha-1,3-D-xylosyltransferase n=1 Tax=Phlebotomus kandelakii TaxID=1109342 RepID=A0A6B2EA77_9DIPT
MYISYGLVIFILFYWLYKLSPEDTGHLSQTNGSKRPDEVVIAVVTCGSRLHETLNMLKSVLLFNTNEYPLKFVIITEESLMTSFSEKLGDWKELLKDSFTFELMTLTFPEKNREEWINLFKPCAAQRLFLPSLLSHIDSVLYMDTDTLFLSSVVDAWKMFRQFNESQMVGLSPEHEDVNVGWYNRFARHPFYGPLGLNSGVMLMNLTRMRAFEWEQKILPIYKEYRVKITWGDQDLINILFHFHPEKLFVFPCEWNYRPDHCMYMSVCKAPSGVRIVHGNRGYFHSEKQPAFREIFAAIEEYQIGSNPYRHFLLPLIVRFKDISVANSNCGKVTDKFIYKAKQMFKDNFYNYEIPLCDWNSLVDRSLIPRERGARSVQSLCSAPYGACTMISRCSPGRISHCLTRLTSLPDAVFRRYCGAGY